MCRSACIRKTIMLIVGVLFLFGTGCRDHNSIKGANSGDYTFQISASGLDREYVVHVPALYNKDLPAAVVIMFHGGGSTAQEAMRETGWVEKADQEGFLAVFPEGSRPDPKRPARFSSNPQTWNDGSGRKNFGAVQRNVDDIGFVVALLADISSRFNVDQNRIYATGFSNGGSMSFRAGRELSNSLAAIACVASTDWMEDQHIDNPVSLLYINGTSDPFSPIDGGEIFIGRKSYGVKPPVKQTIQKWVQMLSCSENSNVIYNNDGVFGIAHSPCIEGSEVVFYTIEGMGHYWPGWIPPNSYPSWLINIRGEPSDKIQGTDVIWKFFQMHQNR